MNADLYVKFSKVVFPKDGIVKKGYFIASIDTAYFYDTKYDQIDEFLIENPNLRKEFPFVFDILYGTIGYESHEPNITKDVSAVKGYAEDIDIDKIYKIKVKNIENGKVWIDKDGRSHTGFRTATIDRIYEITNLDTLDNFSKDMVNRIEVEDKTLSEKEIDFINKTHSSSIANKTAGKK